MKLLCFSFNNKGDYMKKVFIFDFDGTLYSGEHKFDKVKQSIDDNKRAFLPRLTDQQYEIICNENPKWNNVITGNDIIKCIINLSNKYKDWDISIDDFYNWQNDFIYDIVLDYDQIVDGKFLKGLCKKYPVYVVSNSSLKHIYYYMKKIKLNRRWFKEVIGNEFKREDPTKQHYYKEIMEKEEIQPHDIYVLGDSVESDLSPARHLSMNAFYVDNSKNIVKIVNKIIDNEI